MPWNATIKPPANISVDTSNLNENFELMLESALRESKDDVVFLPKSDLARDPDRYFAQSWTVEPDDLTQAEAERVNKLHSLHFLAKFIARQTWLRFRRHMTKYCKEAAKEGEATHLAAASQT